MSILAPEHVIDELVKRSGTSCLSVRINSKARRMNLRVDASSGAVVLTLPSNPDFSAARKFIDAQRDWIGRHAASLPQRTPFVVGAVVPVFGHPHAITKGARSGTPVIRTAGQLVVAGDARHVSRRVADYLRRLAASELTVIVADLARRIDRPVSRVTVRDPKSRWGSCSSTSALSFSWRLVMAPRSVLTYVAAHEVAHLRHANHGPDFWALVGVLHPGFEQDRQMLKHLAFDLHRFGAPRT